MSLTSSTTECNCQVCCTLLLLVQILTQRLAALGLLWFAQSWLVDSGWYNNPWVYWCNLFLKTTDQLKTCKTESQCLITSNVIKSTQFKK